MPCDLLLLSGSAIMNESMLTGESIPVVKNELTHTDKKFDDEEKLHILYSGTDCLQSTPYNGSVCVGMVMSPGFYTIKGALVRSILYPKKTKFKFEQDSYIFIGLMFIISILGVFYNIFYLKLFRFPELTIG
jgi:cation-transporting P-type ATPase 13A2